MNATIDTLEEETRKYQSAKTGKREQFTRASEIKERLRALEGESLAILRSSPKASVLYEQWKTDIEYLQREFVSELAERVQAGRSTKIRFDSPGAMAFICGDRWLEMIAVLAQQLAAGTKSEGRTISSINDEILVLRSELSRLG